MDLRQFARRILRNALRFYNIFKRGRHRWSGRAEVVRDAREWCVFWVSQYRRLKRTQD